MFLVLFDVIVKSILYGTVRYREGEKTVVSRVGIGVRSVQEQ